ncbi:hypothetical protein E1B28_004728 [Marasmius oreades]|uniref:Uncharacterized protein n=1 Tax=Marasmius oreades TaxID=181124 RepID=A0A9P8ADD8_9AGAR|nr:uncharacterized protein E1B28_004728 [Marasmius oreades]KAG7097378.1 hypothetical protein E1B28_004728 [Marasmius oreades]
MLGNSATTSRPRPPAQMRRSSSMKAAGSSPPPPYASSFVFPSRRKQAEAVSHTLLDSPVSAALHTLAQDMQSNSPNRTPVDNGELTEWLKGKSHDELSELLVKADETIKQRETDLNRTHSLCRSLFEDNTSLQSKHKALFSQLPGTPPRRRSPSSSPSGSRFSSFSSSKHRPSPSTDSLIHTPPISRSSSDQDPFYPSSRLPPIRHKGPHVRKMSVTPHDIALLSDQNIDLLLKVEKLESDSASQDLAGRKLLRRLEKEINALHDELDAVREKEALNVMKATEKAEREEKQKRGKGQGTIKSKSGQVETGTQEGVDLGDGSVRDFAPAGPLTGLFRRSTDQHPATISESFEDNPGSESSTPTSSTSFEEQQREFIAQVLNKMAELEETNARLEAQQAETAAQLLAIQKETASLGRVYEGLEGFIGAGEGFELVQDDSPSQSESDALEGKENTLNPADTTVRFRSFKRTLEGLPSIPLDRSEGVGLFNPDSAHFQTHKSRKTVLGLFEGISSPSEIPSNQHPVATDGLLSPTPSTLSAFKPGLNSLDSLTPPDPSCSVNEALSNELGLNIVTAGLTWAGPSDHLRTSSLYDFSSLSRQASSTPSPSPSPIDFNKAARRDMEVENREKDWKANPKSPKTPIKSDPLQLTLEPPTPQQSAAQKRYQRMSQTVRARTARWVDGRFTENVLSPSACVEVTGSSPSFRGPDDREIGSRKNDGSSPLISDSETVGSPMTTNLNPSPAQPMPLRLATVLDSVVEKFTGRTVNGSGPANEPLEGTENSVRLGADTSVELFVAPGPPEEKKAAGVGEIILEVWLWLQFAVIILVFLWAMAKRGPKSVLGDRSSVGGRGP